MRAVLWLHFDPAGNIAWHGGVADQFEIEHEIGATERKGQPRALGSNYRDKRAILSRLH
jgi:hypothetical protein